MAHGVRADAGIVAEASAGNVNIACRGSLLPTIMVPGRPGHAGLPQAHWSEGGAVNAIEKAALIADAMRRFEADWRARSSQHHPYLSPGGVVPTMVAAGEWMVSYPSSCRLDYHVSFLPAHADAGGWGTAVADEMTTWMINAAKADPWLAAHPPRIAWAPPVPAAEIAPDVPIVPIVLAAGAAVERPGLYRGGRWLE